jgi:hypothetical protein
MTEPDKTPILDYLYWEPFIESWVVSFYASGEERNTVVVRHESDCGQSIKKIIKNFSEYIGMSSKITRICHSGGKRFSVWLENEKHVNASDMSLFADYALEISKEAEKELISQSSKKI